MLAFHSLLPPCPCLVSSHRDKVGVRAAPPLPPRWALYTSVPVDKQDELPQHAPRPVGEQQRVVPRFLCEFAWEHLAEGARRPLRAGGRRPVTLLPPWLTLQFLPQRPKKAHLLFDCLICLFHKPPSGDARWEGHPDRTVCDDQWLTSVFSCSSKKTTKDRVRYCSAIILGVRTTPGFS